MTRRGVATIPAAVALAAGLAWWLTVDRMRGMDAGPSAQLGGIGWFTATWLLMMSAMMLPATVPMLRPETTQLLDQSIRWRQCLAPTATVVAYLAVWTLIGALAYLVLQAGRSLFGAPLEWDRAGRWLSAAVIAVAAGYQLTDAKGRWLVRCHAPAISPGATIADGLRAGDAPAYDAWPARGRSWPPCSRWARWAWRGWRSSRG